VATLQTSKLQQLYRVHAKSLQAGHAYVVLQGESGSLDSHPALSQVEYVADVLRRESIWPAVERIQKETNPIRVPALVHSRLMFVTFACG
jgi:hypothetical protein